MMEAKRMDSNLVIPAALLAAIKEGNVVLFLGSGASKGAEHPDGVEIPVASELVTHISDKYLGGKFKDRSLASVAELAISENDLFTVQDFLHDFFVAFEPADHHLAIPLYKWRGIATTNYDLIIEKAYDKQQDKVQTCVPFLSDSDRIGEKNRSEHNVVFLKLHGCITRTHVKELPLILSIDQYAQYKRNRKRLFAHIHELGAEHPILFIGQHIEDIDLRHMLIELSELESRSRYYVLRPNVDEIEVRFWESKQMTIIDGTLSEFMEELGKQVSTVELALIKHTTTSHPIRRKFATKQSGSESLWNFLDSSIDFIHSAMSIDVHSPPIFYKGFDLGWYPIENNLDIKRSVSDTILAEVFLLDESDRPAVCDFYLIKSEAGGGKSVTLRRLAWDAGILYGKVCIYLKDEGFLDYEAIKELADLCNERIYLLVDNAVEWVFDLENLIKYSRRENLKLTVITAERTNEWNIYCQEVLDKAINREYPIRYLHRAEIEELVDKLELHKSLGRLEDLSKDARIEAFVERAGRQLLVSLHEATLGKPFEDIIEDEYRAIMPAYAQKLYLSVCVLNRFHVQVRAGIISRMHSIPFETFKEKFHKPLEHVVHTQYSKLMGDYTYTARHEEIAEIVFSRILQSSREIFLEYYNILQGLDLLYKTDYIAFKKMIRGRNVINLITDHQDAVKLFELAMEISDDDPYILHQYGIYEMGRPNGNYETAEELLERALDKQMGNESFIHSLAELALKRAEASTDKPVKSKLLNKAMNYARTLLDSNKYLVYPHHTIIKARLMKFKELIDDDYHNEKEMNESVQRIEESLAKAFQVAPEDQYIKDAEASFKQLLSDNVGALKALEAAFTANPHEPYIALRLAKQYNSMGKYVKEKQTLDKALQGNRGHQQLNLRYARSLMESGSDEIATIIYHLRRSFTRGDRKYFPQFWYARYLFESDTPDDHAESLALFKRLRQSHIGYDDKMKIRDRLCRDKKPIIFTGRIKRISPSYGFIDRDKYGDLIFFYKNDTHTGDWEEFKIGKSVSFNIGFAYSGPIALNLKLL